MGVFRGPRIYPKNEAEAAAWLLARRGFEYWCKLCGYEWAAHHRRMGEELERVARGELGRLSINMPPGAGKSIYASGLFVPWYLGMNGGHFVIGASHTQEMADWFGRQIRNRVEEKGHILGLELSEDSQAASRWAVRGGGEYFGVGVGGSVTGRRADLVILDDLISGAEAADSKLQRDRLWDWLHFDLLTRLKPGGRVVLIMTRWHEDDVAGRLFDPRSEYFDEREAGRWRRLIFPMEAEEGDELGRKVGEILWPEYFTREMVEAAKRKPRVWSALYQQRPAPEEGAFFKREWLVGYGAGELPKNLRYYMASDHAVSTRQGADRTCLLVAGVDEAGVIWVLPETKWGVMDAEAAVEGALELVEKFRPVTWWAERGHITQSLGPFLRKRMMERRVYAHVEEVVPARDKQQRAQSVHGRMAMGMVRFPKFAPWWAEAEVELLSFPRGAHDDFVDALAWLGRGLAEQVGARPVVRKEERPRPFTGAWLNWLEERDRVKKMVAEARLGW